MRGEKFCNDRQPAISKGITPACAGKSLCRPLEEVCGTGSPPLARGKGGGRTVQKGLWRITPACAGKSIRLAPGVLLLKDHPRLRGEKSTSPRPFSLDGGSPPLARGKGGRSPGATTDTRITPACAGKSLWREASGSLFSGSPPLARGKGQKCHVGRAPDRITPACAGKRSERRKNEEQRQDHPRLRGEKATAPGSILRPVGSPPLARGKESISPMLLADYRITPACAGKSMRPWQTAWRAQDHPRLRGEKTGALKPTATLPGSPPLARGKDEVPRGRR